MRRIVIGLQVVFFCCTLTFANRTTQEEGRFSAAGLNEHEVNAFFVSLKQAIAKDDKKAVASLISYPARVTLTSGRPNLKESVSKLELQCHEVSTTSR